MRAGEALCAVDGESVVRVGGDGCVFGGEGDVEAADAEVWVLDVEVVGVAHGTVLENGDADVAVRPYVDRMGAVARERRVQVFPKYVDFVLQVDEENISVAAGTP